MIDNLHTVLLPENLYDDIAEIAAIIEIPVNDLAVAIVSMFLEDISRYALFASTTGKEETGLSFIDRLKSFIP